MLRIHDAILTAGFGPLVNGLAAISSEIRRHIAYIVAGDRSELALVPVPINRAGRAAVKKLNDRQTDNGALFAFGVATLMLVGLLFNS